VGTDNPRDILFQGLLEQFSHNLASFTETAERLATGVVNNVLEVRTVTLDANGTASFSWGSTCGAIEVCNHTSAEPVYVSASTNSGSPTPSMPRVDPGTWRYINVASRNVTIYGEAGAIVGIQAFTRGGIGAGVIAVNGGAP